MRTNNAKVSANNKKSLFDELLSVTAPHKSTSIPQAPPMPSKVSAVKDARAEKAATLLRQLHRVVCNQSWSLRHVEQPVVKQQVVVGVREACMRLTLRAIARSEFKLKPTKTRVTLRPVVGDAPMRAALRAIARQEFTLKPTKTRETRRCVVINAKKSKFVLPATSVQLNHVNTRVIDKAVVGVRETWTRLALRAIERGEYELKHVAEPTRVTHAVVVREKSPSSNAELLRRNAAVLTKIAESGADVFAAIRLFEGLDDNARKLVVELLNSK